MTEKRSYKVGKVSVTHHGDDGYRVTAGRRVLAAVEPSGDDDLDFARAVDFANMFGGGTAADDSDDEPETAETPPPAS